MPRDLKHHERVRRTKARRADALARIELREPSSPRVAPAAPTSFPIKAEDPEVRRMIDEALARRKGER